MEGKKKKEKGGAEKARMKKRRVHQNGKK